MKRLFCGPIWWLLLAVPGIAADLEIVVPGGVLEANQHYLFPVVGLTTEDLKAVPKILVEPKAANTSVVGVTGWAGEQYLWWIAREEGRHFVAVCVIRDGVLVAASAVIDVGKPDPPVPPVPPPVPGDLAVVLVFEVGKRTAQEAIVQLGLRKYLISKNLWYRIEDKNVKDSVTGQAPKWLEAARAKIAEKSIPLPALVVGSVADDVFVPVAAEVVPNTVEAAVVIVEKYATRSFYPTPDKAVRRILKEAKLTKDDVVYDFGCGDGRICNLAAALYGCRAVGVDMNPNAVLLAQQEAKRLGVSHRVKFIVKDAADCTLKYATVLVMYLDSELCGRILAKRYKELPKGARVFTYAHKIPGFDVETVYTGEDCPIYKWRIPVKRTAKSARTPVRYVRKPCSTHGCGNRRCGMTVLVPVYGTAS